MTIQAPPFRGKLLRSSGGTPPVGNSAIKLNNFDSQTDNIVSLPEMTAFSDLPSGGGLTLSYWMKVVSYPPALQLFSFARTNPSFDPDNGYWYSYFSNSGVDTEWGVSASLGGGSQVGNGQVIPNNLLDDWTHIALTYTSVASGLESTSFSGYADGVFVQSDTFPIPAIPLDYVSGDHLALFSQGDPSGGPDTQPCEAYIADFRVYNAVLNGTQIADLAAKQNVTANLIHRYKFNDTVDDSVGSADGTKGSNIDYALGPSGLPA